MSTETYNCVTVVLLFCTLIAGCATVVVYFCQLAVMQRSLTTMQDTLKAQNLAGLIQYLQSEEVRCARTVVITKLKSKPYDKGRGWTDDEKAYAATACSSYGIAGIMLKSERVDRAIIAENWGPSIRAVCDICKEFIEERRAEAGDKYWKALLWLNEQAKASA